MYEKYIIIGCLIGIIGPSVCLHDALKKDYNSFYLENFTIINIIYVVVRILKGSLDIYIFSNLFRILRLFLKIKFALMHRKSEKKTFVLLSVVSAIYFVLLLNLFHAIMW
jgi:hypothetical protein